MIEPSLNLEGLDMQLKAWSYSRLTVFDGCKYRAKLAYVDKIPEPPRPLPPGKSEHANDRGTRLHEAAEKYVHGGVELVPELAQYFQHEFVRARELFKDGKATTEGDWGFNRAWEPVAWMSSDVWLRVKCDLVVNMSESELVVIDYKSGKRFGNELKHAEQMHLYVVSSLCRFPKTKKVTTELWYLDQNELATMTYTREQGLRFLTSFERRGDHFVACADFPPNPSTHTCRFCPYKPKELGGTGHCPVGV
jgi:hypothetical protein